MPDPSATNTELARLTALDHYAILDTLPEEEYNELTQLAAHICQAPIALITFVDHKRQWFKSVYGIQVQQTPREGGFCTHTINHPLRVHLVEDARLDACFTHHPLVTGDPHIVFYAGIPLIDEQGFALGSLCIIDTQPRPFTPLQETSLKTLAKQVVRLLQLRKQGRLLRQSEELAQQLAQTLEQQVAQRTRELVMANWDLTRSNENLQQFAYIASHDLQEPLRKIQSFGDVLKSQYREHLGEGVDMLERMQGAANRMSVLIRDLLSFSRIATRQDISGSVALSEVVGAALVDLDVAIAEAGAQVAVGELPVVRGDSPQLVQLFQNLLSNALKFRQSGVAPLIRIQATQMTASELPGGVHPARSAENYYCIEVSDNGIGFEQKYVDRIFQVFQRLHGKAKYTGTGIGLAICEKVVTNHGGAITAVSHLGQGAAFSIYLPI